MAALYLVQGNTAAADPLKTTWKETCATSR